MGGRACEMRSQSQSPSSLPLPVRAGEGAVGRGVCPQGATNAPSVRLQSGVPKVHVLCVHPRTEDCTGRFLGWCGQYLNFKKVVSVYVSVYF